MLCWMTNSWFKSVVTQVHTVLDKKKYDVFRQESVT